MNQLTRRTTLKGLTALPLIGCAARQPETPSPLTKAPWHLADKIANDIVAPQFPDQDFTITDFGAVGDNTTDCSQAFTLAITACHNAGGGRVVVPQGTFLSGPIHLKSNVNLHVSQGATIAFHTDPKRYLPEVFTRWEGVEFMGYSPLIYAYEQNNIAVTGKGILDGRANETTWWPWKGNQEWGKPGFPSQEQGRNLLFADAEAGVPPEDRHYGEGYYFRPPFVQPYRCHNILIEDVTIVAAPFWLLNPVLCENVTVRGVTLKSLGPNSDGCDPESCKNILIENCHFDTGDDCIAIKSGRNADGRRINTPTENVVIRNCEMLAGHGGVVIGSEISGGVRYVFAEKNTMSSPDLERGFRIKTNSIRGGVLEHLYMRNCSIGTVQNAIVINFHYEEGDAGNFDPTVRHVEVNNLSCENAGQVFQVRGFERAPITDLRFINCQFKRADTPGIIENVDKLVIESVLINGKTFKT
ncbi:glycoside hydrolase family 28 protein [Gilvimarinus polysaccharolyticus]|uniref:glycoside hydrolase family 28 protein n=1 Tax=Gilvimarinus polysaccharolyticus TaxID=863921 RepID=UPI000673B50A|nr:glycoside hydrolase family 28 protein [Gilvimarinus polysaccharolyticus]